MRHIDAYFSSGITRIPVNFAPMYSLNSISFISNLLTLRRATRGPVARGPAGGTAVPYHLWPRACPSQGHWRIVHHVDITQHSIDRLEAGARLVRRGRLVGPPPGLDPPGHRVRIQRGSGPPTPWG